MCITEFPRDGEGYRMGEKEPESDRNPGKLPRRTVLKTAGAGTVGGAMLGGPATARNTSQMQASDNSKSGNQASTYLMLFDHTAKRRENIGGLPEAVQQGNQMAEEYGAELVGLYFGSIGLYDGFAVVRFPDTESAEAFRLEFELEGTHEFELYEIWPPEEYFQLVDQATD